MTRTSSTLSSDSNPTMITSSKLHQRRNSWSSIIMLFVLSITMISSHMLASAFAPSCISTRHNKLQYISSSSFKLNAVADPPMMPAEHQDDKRKKKKDQNNSQNNNEEDELEENKRWRPMNGGFLLPKRILRKFKSSKQTQTTNTPPPTTTQPSSSTASTTTPKKNTRISKTKHQHPDILTIDNIMDYKEQVALELEQIVVVRFFASWCKSCRASEPLFHKLVHTTKSKQKKNGNGRVSVKFVQVPLNKHTAYLQEGLGVPSVPYAHIYHPGSGLVEELKLNKREMKKFSTVLESYIVGGCDLDDEHKFESDVGIVEENDNDKQEEEDLLGAFE